jgi:hypothetical protein
MLAREWASAAEIAEMRLKGMPTTKEGVRINLHNRGAHSEKMEGYTWRKRKKRGGGVEYRYITLPDEARADWIERFGYSVPDETTDEIIRVLAKEVLEEISAGFRPPRAIVKQLHALLSGIIIAERQKMPAPVEESDAS